MVVAMMLVVLALCAGVVALVSKRPASEAHAGLDVDAIAAAEAPGLAAMAETTGSSEATGAPGVRVEVPDVTGKRLTDAQNLLEVAGFEVAFQATPAGESPTDTVLAQDPPAGSVVPRGSRITLTYADTGVAPTLARDPEGGTWGTRFCVCIDPGHQDEANLDPEPIGPGSQTTKPKVTAGAVGVVTKQRESDLALEVAQRLKRALEARGVRVVLTRTTGAVDVSNAERARIANEAGADLFIRIHADGNANADVRGISTLYPAGNAWVVPIRETSLKAAQRVHAELLRATGAADRGLVGRADLAGFNWSQVPAILIECGLLTNPVEDRLLASDAYQEKLAKGMADGIMRFLRDE